MSARERYIYELIAEGYTAQEAVVQADKVYPVSAPRRVVENSAEIVDAVVSPVALTAKETSGIAKRVIKNTFKMWK